MKKNIKTYGLYIGLLILGIFIGNFFNASEEDKQHATTPEKKQWTCSMHPQILQPDFGDCPICGMDLIPAESGGAGLEPHQFEMTETAMALADVQTSAVTYNTAQNRSVELPGRIVVNKDKVALQTAHFAGRLEVLHINYVGQRIRKGQLLSKVYSPELLVAQKELLTALSLKDQQPELYRAAKEKLKLWKLSDTTIEQIEKSKKILEYFPVYADFSGVVLELMVSEGDHLKEGTGLFRVAPLATVWATFDAYEHQTSIFKIGDPIQIKTLSGFEENAKITFIDPLLHTQKRTFQIRALLKNPNNQLKPGMFVKASLQIPIKNKKLTIAKTAVLWTGKRSVVYVKEPQKNIFQMREIVLDNTNFEGFYQVLQGLEEGESVVTKGVFTIDAAAQLLNKKSMMNSHLGENISNKTKLSSGFKKNFERVLEAYFDLKDTFVKTDFKAVQRQNRLFLKHLEKFNAYQRKEQAYWQVLFEKASLIEKAQNIKMQRIYFKPLSKAMMQITQQIQLPYPVIIQYCPMADEDRGAYWLSKQKKIINPYFGDEMLTCGEVVKILEH